MTENDVLELLKTDLGITITKRDTYFKSLLDAAKGELDRKGIAMDYETSDIDDIFLLVDYAAWNYRKRLEGAPLSENLRIRIHNRIMRNRARGGAGE